MIQLSKNVLSNHSGKGKEMAWDWLEGDGLRGLRSCFESWNSPEAFRGLLLLGGQITFNLLSERRENQP